MDGTGPDPDPPDAAPRRRRRGRLAALDLDGLPRTRELTALLRRAYDALENPAFSTIRSTIQDDGGGFVSDASLSRMLSPNRAGKDNLAAWDSYVHLFRALDADPAPHRALWEGADEEWRDRAAAAPDGPAPPPDVEPATSTEPDVEPPPSHPETVRGRSPRRRRRLVLLAAVVFVVLVAAVATVVGVLVGGSQGDAAPGSCSKSGTPPPGPFTVALTYRGHGHLYCRYASRYQWMNAVRDDEVNGLHGVSGYSSFDVGDGTTGMELFASFGTCSPGPTAAACPLALSVVHPAVGPPPLWSETVELTCATGAVPTTRSGREDVALQAFFTDVASIEQAGRGTAAITAEGDHTGGDRCG